MARRFRFKLDAVLRYREMIEKEKQKEFAVANRAVEEQRQHLEQMAQDRLHTQEDVRDLYQENAAFHQVVENYRHINVIDKHVNVGLHELKKLEQEAERRRQVYIAARRDRRGVEILKEKRQDEHAREEEREAQRELDELGIMARRHRTQED